MSRTSSVKERLSSKFFKSKEARILAEFELDSNFHSEYSKHRRHTFINREYDDSYQSQRSFKHMFYKPSFQLIVDSVLAIFILLILCLVKFRKKMKMGDDIEDTVK